jgi:hypothetical protein
MKTISKSRYTQFLTCPKKFWLGVKEVVPTKPDMARDARFENGHRVGEMAKGLFKGIIDVTTTNADGTKDYAAMVAKTKDLLTSGAPAIAEAAFSCNKLGVYCAVDILENNKDGTYDIYEVKSSTGVKPNHLTDIAFQRFVLAKCGLKINKCFVVHVNKHFVKSGNINPHKYFKIADVTDDLQETFADIEDAVAQAQDTYEGGEPDVQIGPHCHEPYACDFYDHCTKDMVRPSIFDLYYVSKVGYEHFNNGIKTFEDVRNHSLLGTLGGSAYKKIRELQVNSHLDNLPIHVEKMNLQKFLGDLKFPLYFFDFEAYDTIIPIYDGESPTKQVPFQYSLHILQNDGKLTHEYFLSQHDKDGFRELTEKMLKDIKPGEGSIISYHKSYEATRIKQMAERFTDLEPQLSKLIKRLVDLKDPFTKGFVYCKEFTPSDGSLFSLKNVLPSLFPGDPDLDYGKLNVQDGTAAQATFATIGKVSPTERAKLREDLLKYCERDTFAMVKVYEKLCELAK